MREALATTTMLILLFGDWARAQDKPLIIEETTTKLPLEITLDPHFSFDELFADELSDELYPRPYFELNYGLTRYELFGDNYLATKEWEEIEDETFDDAWDGFRHTLGVKLVQSGWYTQKAERLEGWHNLRIKPYLQRRRGMQTNQKLVVDTELKITQGVRGKNIPELDIGARFDKLDNPGFYLRFRTFGNGNGERLENELLWHPIREEAELSFLNLPKDTDFSITWEYVDKEVEFRFLKNPFARWFEFSEDDGAYFSVNYNYDDDKDKKGLGLIVGYYTRF